MFDRIVTEKVLDKIGSQKAIIITGPRQVGKTTLIETILANKKFLEFNGDDAQVRNLLGEASLEQLKQIIGNYELVFIDEAQKINGIGNVLKLITDKLKNVQLLISGSSSFDIGNQLNEPLTGRKWEYKLYPICWQEYETKIGYLNAQLQLENRLITGMYPDVLMNKRDEKEVLRNLTNSYLYKDVLALTNIKRSDVLDKILQALAYQVGSEVSYNEIAKLVGVDKNTVNNYIEILCKAFIIFKLPSFSRNLRNEIKVNQKIYFYDNGIRNMVIGNLQPIANRNDIGALWENFVISEKVKYNEYFNPLAKLYFWRTKSQKEIDLVQDVDGIISAYDCKWSETKSPKRYADFETAYNAIIKSINKTNFREALMTN
jgi:uncharacterized protein